MPVLVTDDDVADPRCHTSVRADPLSEIEYYLTTLAAFKHNAAVHALLVAAVLTNTDVSSHAGLSFGICLGSRTKNIYAHLFAAILIGDKDMIACKKAAYDHLDKREINVAS